MPPMCFVGICKGHGRGFDFSRNRNRMIFRANQVSEVVRKRCKRGGVGSSLCWVASKTIDGHRRSFIESLCLPLIPRRFSVAIRAGDGRRDGGSSPLLSRKNNSALAFQQLDPICPIACTTDGVFNANTQKSPWKRCLEFCHWQYHAVSALVGLALAQHYFLGMIPIPHRISL